jgi:hypothetical protein
LRWRTNATLLSLLWISQDFLPKTGIDFSAILLRWRQERAILPPAGAGGRGAGELSVTRDCAPVMRRASRSMILSPAQIAVPSA